MPTKNTFITKKGNQSAELIRAFGYDVAAVSLFRHHKFKLLNKTHPHWRFVLKIDFSVYRSVY